MFIIALLVSSLVMVGLASAELPNFDTEVVRVSELDGTHGYPRVSASENALWITHVTSYTEGDIVVARRFDGETFGPVLRVSEGIGIEHQPVIAAETDESAWVAWSAWRGGRWMILARQIGPDGPVGGEVVLEESDLPLLSPAIGAQGPQVRCAWRADTAGGSAIHSNWRIDGAWQGVQTVSGDQKECYRPAIFDGQVAWDTFDGSRYVCAMLPQDSGIGLPRVLAADGEFLNADVRLAEGPTGTTWFTYLKDGRYTTASVDGHRPESADNEPSGSGLRPAIDPAGRLWLVNHRGEVNCWSDQGVSNTIAVAHDRPWSNLGERSEIAFVGSTLWIVWEDMAGNINMRSYDSTRAEGGALEATAAIETRDAPQPRVSDPAEVDIDGQTYQVLFGDLHCHSVGSEGWGYYDWLYNKARYRLGMDFIGTADHDNSTPDYLGDSEWALISLSAKRFNGPGAFTAFAGWEVSAPSQRAAYGDRNAWCLEDDMPILQSRAAEYRNPMLLYARLAEGGYFGHAGHHISRGFSHIDWTVPLNEAVPVVEISSVHGVFEYTGNPSAAGDELPGLSWQDGLAMGHRVGCISSTDNHNPGQYGCGDYAVVLAEENTRAAIWDAIRQRRCYASRGSRYVIDFRVDGHVMGQEVMIDAPGEHEIAATVRSLSDRPLGVVELLRNNQVVHRVETDQTSIEIDYTDDGDSGAVCTYYYLRVTTSPGRHMAWSSPVWLTSLQVEPTPSRPLIGPGRSQPITVSVTSPVDQSITLRAIAPEGWQVDQAEWTLDLSADVPAEIEMTVTAPDDTHKRHEPLRFAVETVGGELAVLRPVSLWLDPWPSAGPERGWNVASSTPASVLTPAEADAEVAGEHFVRTWSVLGPFWFNPADLHDIECRDAVDLTVGPFDEATLGGSVGLQQGGHEWVRYAPQDDRHWDRGQIVLDTHGMRIDACEHAVAYLAADVIAPEAIEGAALLTGSDDYLKVWLNGERVHTYNDERRGVSADDDATTVDLREGRNHIVVKCINVDGGWGMSLRFVDAQGRALIAQPEE